MTYLCAGARTVPVLLALALISIAASPQAQEAVGGLTANELTDQMAAGTAPLILDVRSDAEFQSGHISGALHIPYDQLSQRLAELPSPDTPIVVYCHSGRRAAAAETVLDAAGFTRVMDLEGHWRAWDGPREPTP